MELDKKTCNVIFSIQLLASIVSSLLQTALTTALPVIMVELNITATTAQWLTSGYTLAMGIMIPATAFLIRRVPTKKLFFSAITLFSSGILFAAFANSFEILMCGRILQALGTGILLSMTQVVILTIYPPEKRGSVMGLYGLAVGAAPIIAPTLAGIIIDAWNWQAIFWFALIIVIFDMIVAAKFFKNILQVEKQKFDSISMLLVAIGFSGLLLGLGNLGSQEFFSMYILLPLVIGIVGLSVFSIRQLHLDIPFLELRILKKKEFRLAVIISMLFYAVMIASSTLLPIYIQTLCGFSATKCGLIMMPGSLVMAFINPFAGKFYDKFGIRKLAVFGSLCLLLSCIGLAIVNVETSMIYISFIYIIRLIGIGLIMMPIVTWGMHVIDDKYTSHGTALLTSLRTISGAIGSAVFVAIMTIASNLFSNSNNSNMSMLGMNVAFICITIISVVQLVIVYFYVDRKKVRI